jgi:uncharacterized Zn-binding protein involved in type VI secretion
LKGNITVDLSGSGDFEADLADADKIDITADGPGSLTLRGSGKKMNATINGSGDLHASGLLLELASVKVNGPGEATVNVKAANAAAAEQSSIKNGSRTVTIDRNGVVKQ